MNRFRIFFEESEKLEQLIQEKQLTMFFTYENQVYGASEEDRIIFSRLKNPSDEPVPEEPEFEAINIKKTLKGEENTKIFSKKDLDKITIIDKHKILKFLKEENV